MDLDHGLDGQTTVADLVGLIERQRMALTEAGRPDLARHCHVAIYRDGSAHLRFEPIPRGEPDPTVEKALSLDPTFESAR